MVTFGTSGIAGSEAVLVTIGKTVTGISVVTFIFFFAIFHLTSFVSGGEGEVALPLPLLTLTLVADSISYAYSA